MERQQIRKNNLFSRQAIVHGSANLELPLRRTANTPHSTDTNSKPLRERLLAKLSEGKDSIQTKLSEGKESIENLTRGSSDDTMATAEPTRARSGSKAPVPGDWEMDGVHVPSLLIQGTPLYKISEKKKDDKESRVFRLDPDQGQILWPSRKRGIISIENIKELRIGEKARPDIQSFGKDLLQLESRWLTVIYTVEDKYKTLHVYAPSPIIRDMWYDTLSQLFKLRLEFMAGLSTAHRAEAVWDRHHWKGADESGDNKLSFAEVKQLCRRLNISEPEEEIGRRFHLADKENKGHLTFSDFQEFIKELKARPEILNLYEETRGDGVLDLPVFLKFMKEVQHTTKKDSEIEQIYRRFAIPTTPIPPKTVPSTTLQVPSANPPVEDQAAVSYDGIPTSQLPPLTIEGFTNFLQSSDNSQFSEHHMPIWQDMTLPMSNYFICSSHNTYLVGNQLVGESTVEGYIRALLGSCRSVEMDIYDGENGEPMITHGGTLTSDVPLRDICNAIEQYAFASSGYPVIISTEVHCGIEQQTVMAAIFREIFGDKLVTEPLDGQEEVKVLPSPEALKGKILIKAKNKYIDVHKAKAPKLPDELPSSGDEDAKDYPAIEKPGFSSKAKSAVGKFISHSKKQSLSFLKKSTDKQPETQAETPVEPAAAEVPPEAPATVLMAPEILPLILYTTGVSFRGLGPGIDYKIPHLFSLSESRGKGLINSKADSVILTKHTMDRLVRVYPKGTRVDSSNYEPHVFWAVGAQLVTQNWQTVDDGYIINHAMFQRNGHAGYLLKPKALRDPTYPDGPNIKRTKHVLQVRVISAQQLPRPKDKQGREIVNKDTVDPYVRATIHIPVWPAGESSAKIAPVPGEVKQSSAGPDGSDIGEREITLDTTSVRNNGFNPVWDQSLDLPFDVYGEGMRELVFVTFLVKDHDVDRDGFVGVYCSSLGSLELGYRHLPLYDEQMNQYLFAKLFVHLSIRDL